MKGLLSGWGLAARPCDNCRTASALLYCRADAAFLCGVCDSKVHAANCHGVVAVRHERVWLCEVCEQEPAAVTCKADAAVLCSSCDHDIHSANPLARRHERVPVVPFLDSAADAAVRSSSTTANPSAFLDPVSVVPVTVPVPTKFEDEAEAWLIPNLNNTFMYNEQELLNFTNYGENIEKISQQQSYESTQSYAFTDSVVPTQSKPNLSFNNNNNNNNNNNTPNHVFVNSFDIDFSQSEKHKPKNNNQQMELFSSLNFSTQQQSVSSSDIGVVPEANTNSISEASYTFGNSVTSSTAGDSSSPTGATPAPALDRAARVLRYREKRKNRKFEKTIRYASRKAYAETRPRIKGRFVKRTGNINEKAEMDNMFGSGLGSGLGSNFDFVLEGYGVVPTF